MNACNNYPPGVAGNEPEIVGTDGRWECSSCGNTFGEYAPCTELPKDKRWCHACVIEAVKEAVPGAELFDIMYELKQEIEKEIEL